MASLTSSSSSTYLTQKYISPSKRNTNMNKSNNPNDNANNANNATINSSIKNTNNINNVNNANNANTANNANNALDKQSFPTLGETMKNTTKKVMNFASAAQKVEPKIEVKLIISDIKPGWIHIRMCKGKIQFRHNLINKNTIDDEIKEDIMIGNYLFNKRVTIQQWERDVQNELLGDLSPYWNSKTVLEIHDNDDDEEKYYDDDENYSSEYSDSYD